MIPSMDQRVLHVNEADAVRDLARAFRNHLLDDSFENDWYYNVRTMKKIGAK